MNVILYFALRWSPSLKTEILNQNEYQQLSVMEEWQGDECSAFRIFVDHKNVELEFINKILRTKQYNTLI